jgi:hypothetical protein
MPLAWTIVAAMALFSVAATHDHLTLQRATWKLAAEAGADGVARRDLDGGAAWDGYHLYESTLRHPVRVDLAKLRDLGFTGPLLLSPRDGSAWWIGYYTPSVTSRVVVAGDPPVRLRRHRAARVLQLAPHRSAVRVPAAGPVSRSAQAEAFGGLAAEALRPGLGVGVEARDHLVAEQLH